MIALSFGTGVAAEIVGFALAVCLYMLPTIIGSVRRVVNIGSVFAINLLLGWTLIGWAVALAMALRTNPPYAYGAFWNVQASAQPPPPGPPPGWYRDLNTPGVERWWDGTQWTDKARPVDSDR